MTALIPRRGAFGTEYADQLIDFIERTNCLKGCIHAKRKDGYVDCDLGLLGLLSVVFLSGNQPVPEFEAHGNRYVVCTKRVAPIRKPEPPVDLGPDLFSA